MRTEERRAYEKAWREAHREQRRAYQQVWRAMHPDKVKAATKRRAKKTREYHRAYYAANKERILEQHRAQYYKDHARSRRMYLGYARTARLKQYGLTPVQYDALLAAQGGLCAICRQSERLRKGKPMRLAVDHDHTTKRVRGLLCRDCNQAIGIMRHDVQRLTEAVRYLERTA